MSAVKMERHNLESTDEPRGTFNELGGGSAPPMQLMNGHGVGYSSEECDNSSCTSIAASDVNSLSESSFNSDSKQTVNKYGRGEFRCPPPDDTVAAPKPGGAGYCFFKRAFDICFSVGVCAVLAIPVAALCAAICIDSPGKPFFRQERIGRGGKRIYIWKLRSMVPDAHSNPERYMTPEQLETWRREQKLDGDPRVTRVGRFLRRTSLDELPQFINVLTGDLSVIGPRPVTLEETYEFGGARDEFLSCKPGITGWWQVTERNAATWENGRRQLLEIFYVRHASLALDLRIFVKTFKAMRRGQ